MFSTTNVVLVILGHSESAVVDEIALVDDPVHGEDDENEINNAPHQDAVNIVSKKVIINNYTKITLISLEHTTGYLTNSFIDKNNYTSCPIIGDSKV